MLNFFNKAIIFPILTCNWKYLDELIIHRKSWYNGYNIINTHNVRFTRLLSSKTKVEEKRKTIISKNRINGSLYQSDDSLGERINSFEEDNILRKRFIDLMQRDITDQEFNDLMKYTMFPKQHDSLNTQRNLKTKCNNIKQYNNINKHKIPHTYSKKVDSKNESSLFQNSSSHNHRSFKNQDIDKNLLYSRKSGQVYSSIMLKKKLFKKGLLIFIALIVLCICITLISYYVLNSNGVDISKLKQCL
ncbi:hypothetical protein MKS88_005227 [Plasmodium brasilianum]|uniref:Uncharacterized protein n=1 Tax=Plasmodium brasilianum TaxID=5824 RepID=A0ACB9Y605_PLABR|nr:hypothetical protein MKS88_005227 [Plasmodium brasilianum]